MWLFPAISSAVALAFSALLLRRYLTRRRSYQLLWAAALLMYAGASVALVFGVTGSGWTPGEYRAYWLLGAVLNVPYLAMGEVYLLLRRRGVANALFLVLLFATAFAFNRIRTATLVQGALATDLPRGSQVWANDPFALDLARIYSLPAYLLLLVGTLWSAWGMRTAAEQRNRFLGTVGIAVGATVVAAGSAFALTGNLPGFSISITAGIAAMFWGFLRASRPAGSPTGEVPTPTPG